jgi:hypothetical protein
MAAASIAPNKALQPTALPAARVRFPPRPSAAPAAAELRRWAGKAGFATLSELRENLSAISSRVTKS